MNKAWVFHGVGRPLELTELPVPTAQEGEVVVEVKAAGLCHSDIGIIDGVGQSWISHLPIVLGHEVAGVVSEVGPGVDGIAVGDRVGIGLLSQPVASHTRFPGLTRDGGYGHYAVAEAVELVPIPDEVSFEQAAAATDSVATAYHAVKGTAGVSAGTTIGIVGLGGLGLNAVQVALLEHATVYGVDPSEDARKRAESLGAKAVFTDVSELASIAPDVIIDFAGFGTTTKGAIEAVRRGGRVVQVGMGTTEATIDTGLLVVRSVSLVGSLGAGKSDLEEIYALIADKQLEPQIETLTFEEIPAELARLRDGGVTGRLVATYPAEA